MASVNKVILVGNLGRSPEVRYTPDGMAVCNVSLATTSSWKDKQSGQRREETEWHRVVFHARLAEIVGEYLVKGSQIYVEGRLRTRKWQDRQTGQDRYATEVVADQMQMLGGKSNHPAQQAAAPTQSPQPSRQDTTQQQPGDLDDDIPF